MNRIWRGSRQGGWGSTQTRGLWPAQNSFHVPHPLCSGWPLPNPLLVWEVVCEPTPQAGGPQSLMFPFYFPGPMCDLLWSDPQPQVSFPRGHSQQVWAGGWGWTGTQSSLSLQNGRSVSKRGVSCQFGPDVTKAFLEENHLDYIIRSHEVKAEGYEVAHGGRCVTVFSAPNYWCVPIVPTQWAALRSPLVFTLYDWKFQIRKTR